MLIGTFKSVLLDIHTMVGTAEKIGYNKIFIMFNTFSFVKSIDNFF